MIVTLAFYKGRGRFADWLIRTVTRGDYSHVEAIRGPVELGGRYACFSASARDGGVRSKMIALDPTHWDLVEIDVRCDPVAFVGQRVGLGYDWLGIALSQILPLARHDKRRWFCSEIIGAGLGLDEPQRLCPQMLFDVVTWRGTPWL